MAKPQKELTPWETQLIIALVELGKTDAEIARIVGYSRSGLVKVLKQCGISDAIKKAKSTANTRVEAALYMKATGYNYIEDVPTADRSHKITLRKHVIPETTAGIFWLCNREPDRWKHVNRVDGTGGQTQEEARRSVVDEIFREIAARDNGRKAPGHT